MFCMPRLMLRAWCASADLGAWVSIGRTASSCVPAEWTVLECRGAVSGWLVPGLGQSGDWRLGWQSGTGVWLSNSWYCPSCFSLLAPLL